MEFGVFDNRKNHRVESEVPSIAKDEPCFMGIDEAGRGPVLGPMVYGICYCPLSRVDMLKTIGFADSKTLTEDQRDDLYLKLDKNKDTFGWIIDILSPNFISNSMLKKNKYNLNTLSHDTAIGLVARVIQLGINLKEVYVDTVGDPKSYQNKFKSLYPNIDFVVSKKADSIYPIVSAASICAKVARDKTLREWKFIEGNLYENIDYGSGYPADPKTKKFLKDQVDPVFGFPQLVRFSWSTADIILREEAVSIKWEDDEEPTNIKFRKSNTELKVSSFFPVKKAVDTKSIKNLEHRFFKDSCLKPVNEIL